MKGPGKFISKLTPQQKILLIIVVIIVVILLRNKIKAFGAALGNQIKSQSEITKLATMGIKATYDNEKYKKLAEYLFNSMNGIGTDETAIYNAFNQLRNDVDFIKLDIAFGVREADDNLFGFIGSENMKGWLRADLSDSSIAQVNEILKNRGITKRI